MAKYTEEIDQHLQKSLTDETGLENPRFSLMNRSSLLQRSLTLERSFLDVVTRLNKEPWDHRLRYSTDDCANFGDRTRAEYSRFEGGCDDLNWKYDELFRRSRR